jgi:SAM-dependent methyltransferase
VPVDKVCSATALPFEDAVFDYHLSFEVLEHINDPEKYFSEASRVLRPGGHAIFSVPFLYRMHGGEPSYKFDYFRYLNGFFYERAGKNNLEVVQIFSNTGYGITMASLTNQWVIRRIVESNILTRVLFFIFSPFIFIFTNVTGFVIDIFPDSRFATRFHVVLKKVDNQQLLSVS